MLYNTQIFAGLSRRVQVKDVATFCCPVLRKMLSIALAYTVVNTTYFYKGIEAKPSYTWE